MKDRTRLLAFCLAVLVVFLPACRDTVWVYSHPPGADLRVDGKPYGIVPESGTPVEVTWTTFSDNRAELRWPNGAYLNARLDKGLGAPNHPEYLVVDGVLIVLIVVPHVGFIFFLGGLVGACVNTYGPTPQQHFYAPNPVPSNEKSPRKPYESKPPEG
ncbi:MAG: hypothetical protein HYR85_26425 [Planctomycetes bacterium]|nr:hypothetical protein [Planctomycetota bacterium]MBI3848445.1 hypothetical protein [Planctomycetota bacterium]